MASRRPEAPTGSRGGQPDTPCGGRRYLRGREASELVGLLREGAATVGVTDMPAHPGELAGLKALADSSAPGDVLALMAPAERSEILAWLDAQGATLLDPVQLRARVVAARAG